MIYITDDDLRTDSFQRFIDDSTADFADAKDNAELKAIGKVKTLIKGRYDVDLIFDEQNPLRDEYMADIITKLTLCKIFKRNAGRKLPTDLKEDWEWAMKQLEKINGGKIVLELPVNTDDEGNPTAKPMFGNNSNKDFYI
ncbi:DUF1320 family protein [Winogradskyella luteola]|uniref:DUF1320 family protein n=1 Tax=Winogradskyella luteola TaxID=2828330 RepID=A0A9X1F6N6_9FLAO|nr:DUF1320 family protein [Winogradskyella luteola]MBV7268382.1 DUF1320 family protein [Winogradskyella luteola]